MKRLFLSFLIISFLVSCKYKNVIFLETDELPSGASNFKYYSKVLTDTSFVFKIDDSFKLSLIGAKDRREYNNYSKVFYGDGEKIKRVENYKRDEFNSHIFYPFLIFDVEERDDSYVISVIKKEWDKDNNKVKDVNVSVEIVQKLSDIEFSDFLEKLKTGQEIKENIKLYFVAFDNESNKKIQSAIAADLSYVMLEGYAKGFEDKKIKLFFFEENRSFGGGIDLNKPYLIKSSYIKTEGEDIHLRFLSFINEEKKDNVGSKMEESVYGSK